MSSTTDVSESAKLQPPSTLPNPAPTTDVPVGATDSGLDDPTDPGAGVGKGTCSTATSGDGIGTGTGGCGIWGVGGAGTGTGTGGAATSTATGSSSTAPPPAPIPIPPAASASRVRGYNASTTTPAAGGESGKTGAGASGKTYAMRMHAEPGKEGAGASGKTYAMRMHAHTRVIKPGGGRMVGAAAAAAKGKNIVLAILAVFVPPLAVGFKVGLVNIDFIINVCLAALACAPGMLYAWYVLVVQHKSRTASTGATTRGASVRAKNRSS